MGLPGADGVVRGRRMASLRALPNFYTALTIFLLAKHTGFTRAAESQGN